MFDSVALDIVIGLIFVYLLYSLLATILQEIIASNFAFRAKVLEKAITRMLDDGDSTRHRLANFVTLFVRRRKQPKVTRAFYSHPLIKYLGQDKYHRKPAYLSAHNFSKVLVDLLRGRQTQAGKDYRAEIEASLSSKKTAWDGTVISNDTIDYLNSIWVDAQGDIEQFKGYLEDWYNETMDRAAGWYKQYTQVILLVVGFGIAMVFNVDTLAIIKKLEKDPKLREQLVAQSEAYAKAHPNLVDELKAEEKKNEKIISDMRDTAQSKPAPLKSLDPAGLKKQDSAYAAKRASLDSASQAHYQTLVNQRNTLFKRADSLVQGDLKKINNSLALGWNEEKRYTEAKGWHKIGVVIKLVFCTSWIKFLGLLLTAIAISLGAPFWFDLLNKLVKLRSALKGGEAEKDTAADPQAAATGPKRVG
jgi:hypothetical protein